ncbi:N-acetyltransferase [Pseudorhodoferax sp. Leaf267]|uniref:GNAT family N-acetyltransferase n=1 Tax=Pseudorhodoferax sp. Leaf267 TaxID=1736316 RepID=UPI0006F43D0D|nr:GNAT family N-acetyltransferase [Pseudorhodoferax sp. Leaf267]KQP22702.1 GCN5 family acetyltransferase [Pseudorhodoferax sp. Leaf267]
MESPDTALVHALEERAFNAWPARQAVLHGGWLFRLSDGFTKRANSANAVLPGASFDGQRAAAEAFYARHGQPAVFRISPLAPPAADRELAEAGYAVLDPSLVLHAPLPGLQAQAHVHVASERSDAWLDGLAAANGVPRQQWAMHHAMVHLIALPAGFATVLIGGQPVAYGLAVLERGAVGLYDLVVAPQHRGQGHGRALVQGLLHWGQHAGAGWAYLQVSAQNAPACALYAALGFTRCYGYHYRAKAA